MESGAAKISKQGFNLKNELYEWLEAIVFAVVAVLIVFTFLFRIIGVEGHSMENTLHDQDRVILTRLFYQPSRGDIVVCALPEKKPIVKRVIAVSGDVVDINFETHEVFVNGEKLNEPYIKEPTALEGDVTFPLTVGPDEIFVMGDNRNNSVDSRASITGNIKKEYIMGKVIFRIFPFDKIGLV